jgi:hypothetical protein
MVEEGINKEIDLITSAHMAAQEVRDEREKLQEVLKKVEAYEARTILAGRSSAGEAQKTEFTPEQKMDLELKQFWKGTAIEGVFK